MYYEMKVWNFISMFTELEYSQIIIWLDLMGVEI